MRKRKEATVKKIRVTKKAVLLAAVILAAAAWLIGSRPMTLSQLYPRLTADKCTKIYVDYQTFEQSLPVEFTAEKGSEAFDALYDLFYADRTYRLSLKTIRPNGTRRHNVREDDFMWTIRFQFEEVEQPDGSLTGEIIHIRNWFGELDISSNADRVRVFRTDGQEEWLREVLDAIN